MALVEFRIWVSQTPWQPRRCCAAKEFGESSSRSRLWECFWRVEAIERMIAKTREFVRIKLKLIFKKIFYLIYDIFKLQDSHTNKTIFSRETIISDADVKLIVVKLLFGCGVEGTEKSFSMWLKFHYQKHSWLTNEMFHYTLVTSCWF